MTEPLFRIGTTSEQIQQARDFLRRGMGLAPAPSAAPLVDTGDVARFADEASAAMAAAAPAAAAPAPAAAVATHYADDAAARAVRFAGADMAEIMRAAQGAAEAAVADPAFMEQARPSVNVRVVPRIVREVAEEVIDIPIDIPAPAPSVHVTFDQPSVMRIDAATGQPLDAPVPAAAPAAAATAPAPAAAATDAATEAATSPRDAFRSMVDDVAARLRGVRAATPAATPVVTAPIEELGQRVVAERPGDRFLAGLADLRTRVATPWTTSAVARPAATVAEVAASVADDSVAAASTVLDDVAKPSLMDDALRAMRMFRR